MLRFWMWKLEVKNDQGDKGDEATNKQIKGQFHGSIFSQNLPTPNDNKQIHGEDCDLVEKE